MTQINAVYNQLYLKCKEYYFRNGLQTKNIKNPMNMTKSELMTFIEKYNLMQMYCDINNNIAEKYNILEYILETNKHMIGDDIKYIMSIMREHTSEVYLVGGCVRDMLLNKKPKDFDIVTNIPYDKLSLIFNRPEFKIKETGKEFLVFNLNYNGIDYEIANFRKDGYSSDCRRPDSVEIGTIQEDAERRDFTINALYYDLENIKGNYESVLDIINKKVRFVGKPDDRLKEDYLRGWRFLRFLNTFKTHKFTPDNNSLKAVRRNWDNIYKCSNPTRVLLELEKMV